MLVETSPIKVIRPVRKIVDPQPRGLQESHESPEDKLYDELCKDIRLARTLGKSEARFAIIFAESDRNAKRILRAVSKCACRLSHVESLDEESALDDIHKQLTLLEEQKVINEAWDVSWRSILRHPRHPEDGEIGTYLLITLQPAWTQR